MKKKILFLINDFNIFTGFFKNDILHISKNYDIYFLIYKSGFDDENFRNYQFNWCKTLEQKKIVKKIIWMQEVSYTNFYENLIFNKKFINIINQVKLLNIDYFLCPNFFYYWEKIFFQIFKKKKIFCYLLNAPTGLDFFNNSTQLKKSLRTKKLFKSFYFKSDNSENHSLNTKNLNHNNFLIFIYQKMNITLSKLVSHYLTPVYLIKRTIKINSIFYKLNMNFFDFDRIIIFSHQFKIFLKNFKLNKDTKVHMCTKYNPQKKTTNYNWIYTYASAKDNQVLSKLFNYLIILKKLKKINSISFKGHPTWKHEAIEKSFFKKLKENGIKFNFIDSYKKINYLKYYGLISSPSTILLESIYNNPDIKIIGINQDKNISSGLLQQFYHLNNKKIIWEPRNQELKKYLVKNKKDIISINNLKNILL